MPRNNSKARKSWRKTRVGAIQRYYALDPTERLIMTLMGSPIEGFHGLPKPGTDSE